MEISGCAFQANQLKANHLRWKMKRKEQDCFIIKLASICILYSTIGGVMMNSINYGISQRPITDIGQLMPTLCQNQSVICEGSFCIPGLRRCVCDLRQPVQFGRFCLRQLDIETKCFVTNQCNHTIKDAVCVDISSNTVLDKDSANYKLEQWQQLHEMRQASKSALSKQENVRQKVAAASSRFLKPMFLIEDRQNELSLEARGDVIMSRIRNSPYEINYYTPELLHQNHTRRKTSTTTSNDQALETSVNDNQNAGSRQVSTDGSIATTYAELATQSPDTTTTESTPRTQSADELASTTSVSSSFQGSPLYDLKNAEASTFLTAESTPTSTQQTITLTSELPRKKTIVKSSLNWPPGICSCPPGHMFDSMLRKCLALSLADSHCQNDNDCKQIRQTHCSSETRKCECDEPLTWNQTELACQRPRPVTIKVDNQASSQSKEGFFENLVPPLLMAKLLPDQSMLLMIFVILVIICTLLLMRCVVKCFSASNSALISPKNSKKRKSGGDQANNLLAPKSPYATLRKGEQYKANTPLANFTQATRGRILNYDFEQDQPIPESRSPQSPQPQTASFVPKREDQQHEHRRTLDKTGAAAAATGGTLSRLKHRSSTEVGSSSHVGKSSDRSADECLELNDNLSLDGQLDSERKSESENVQAIIGPPPSQTPPYMLASAMKGQGSAIAAAAAAVANRRMQMAHKKGLTENGGKVPNGTPVFL